MVMFADGAMQRGRAPAQVDWSRLWLVAIASLLTVEVAFFAQGIREHQWLIDAAGAPLCRDFSVFWASGRFAFQGVAHQAYDWSVTRNLLLEAGMAPDCTMPMFYPPAFLLLLAPFGAAPFVWAAEAWIVGTVAAYLFAVRLAVREPKWLMLALAAPGVMACAAVGQNGLLTAGLALAGLSLIDRRPVLAGVLLGLLAYKPQFGIMLPVALLAAGRWKTVVGAAASVAAGVIGAGLVFGWSIYPQFLQAMAWAGDNIIQAGALADFKQQSVHALARRLGAGAELAWVAQGLVMLLCAAGVTWIWRSAADWKLRSAGLLTAMFAASPYSGIYDFPVLAAAAVLLFSRLDGRVTSAEGALLLGGYLAPLAYGTAPGPIGPFACASLAWVIIRQARQRASNETDCLRASPA